MILNWIHFVWTEVDVEEVTEENADRPECSPERMIEQAAFVVQHQRRAPSSAQCPRWLADWIANLPKSERSILLKRKTNVLLRNRRLGWSGYCFLGPIHLIISGEYEGAPNNQLGIEFYYRPTHGLLEKKRVLPHSSAASWSLGGVDSEEVLQRFIQLVGR